MKDGRAAAKAIHNAITSGAEEDLTGQEVQQ